MGEGLNRTLSRQLRRAGLSESELPQDLDGWQNLLRRISKAYDDANADRYTLERSMAISSRELKAARDAAESANRAKSAFLANMSHEIRTPLNGVIGVAELLRGGDLDREQAKLVATIQRSGESLLVLLNDILDLSKVEAGKFELDHTDFSMVEVVEGACDLLAEPCYRKQVELNCFVAPDVQRHYRGDPQRLRQILLNLVGNAVKFTATGQVHVRVDLLHRDGDQDAVWFEVRDTGIGIDEAVLGELFQPFTQADSTTTRKFGGTGLGLTICRKLIELMGGEIGVESSPGIGSRFWFHVRVDSPSPMPELTVQSLDGMRVLFVDDNPTNRQILKWQTRPLGVQLSLASGGRKALEAISAAEAEDRPFELLILDYLMPEMDGVQLVAELTRRGLAKNSSLIMLSSAHDRSSIPADVEDCLREVLSKPLKQRDLIDALLRIRNSQPAPTQDRAPSTMQPRQLGLRVLLAEDNLVNQRVATMMLASLGCSVVPASNGLEAVEQFGDASFDVILMDCQMPELNGLEATRGIRKIEAAEGRGHTPVIALTANALPSDKRDCLESGMDEFLTKPIKRETLEKALEPLSRRP